MRSNMQDDPMIGPIVKNFVLKLPERTRALLDAQLRADWDGVSTLAHQMAGASGSDGFPQISKVASEIEAEASEPVNVIAIGSSISRFSAMCAAAVKVFANGH